MTEENKEQPTAQPPIVDDGMTIQLQAPPTAEKEAQPECLPASPLAQPLPGPAPTPNQGPTPQPRQERVAEFMRKAAQTAAAAGQFMETSCRKVKQTVETSNPRASLRWIDSLLDGCREIFPPARFDALGDWSTRFGHMALVASQVMAILLFFVAAIKLQAASIFFKGLGYALILLVLQYTADKFIHAGGRLIASSPSRVSSSALTDCLSLLLQAAGIVVFLASLVLAGDRSQWNLVFVGLGAWLVCDAMAYIALNPDMVNLTRTADVTPGEEALGIFSFFAKALLRIVPIAFGLGTLIGAAGVLVGLVSLPFKSGAALDASLIPGQAPLELVAICAGLPIASYLVFCLYDLTTDLLRSILQIPRKLDEAIKK